MQRMIYILLSLQLMILDEAQASSCDHKFYRPNYINRSSLCVLGELIPDQYDGGTLIKCENMEIDHLVSLKQAWENGVCGLELKKLANDPKNLRTTFWLTNRKKGSKSPLEFANSLKGKSKIDFLKSTEIVYRKYNIASQKTLVDLKLARIVSHAKTGSMSFNLLSQKYKHKLSQKIVGKHILYYVGGRLVAVGAGVGTAVVVFQAGDWAFTNLFLPKDTERSSQREKKIKKFLDNVEP